MEKHFELTDAEFERQCRTCEFDPSDFSHEAHLRLAYIQIVRHGIGQAQRNMHELLLNFVKSAGAIDKYDENLTIAATKTVYRFMQQTRADNFKDFITEFPQLKYNFRELLAGNG